MGAVASRRQLRQGVRCHARAIRRRGNAHERQSRMLRTFRRLHRESHRHKAREYCAWSRCRRRVRVAGAPSKGASLGGGVLAVPFPGGTLEAGGAREQLVEHPHALLLVLLPRHPELGIVLHHFGQDGAANEHHVLAPGRVLNSDLEFLERSTRHELVRVPPEHPLQVELLDLSLKAARQTGVHGGPSGQDDVLVELGAHVHVGALDRLEEQLCHAQALHVDQVRLEQGLGGLEPLPAQLDRAPVRQLRLQTREPRGTHSVGFYEEGGLKGQLLVLLHVVADEAELLLDHAHCLKVCRVVEHIATQQQQLQRGARDIPAGYVQSPGQVVQGKALVDRADVGHAVARIHHHPRGFTPTLRVEGEHGLDGDVGTVELVAFEHDLDHALAVLERVHGGLGEQHLALPGIDVQLLLPEGVVPHQAHVIPVAHYTVLHRVLHLQHRPQLRRLVAHHHVLRERSFSS
ncbi:unnamed protein product [Ixodes pacificus]